LNRETDGDHGVTKFHESGPDPALAHWYKSRRSAGCRAVREILAALEAVADLTEQFLAEHPEGCTCDYCAYGDDGHESTGERLGVAARKCIGSLNHSAGMFVQSFRYDCRMSN
jgi:hypothetical protein